jgi:hypothetical protein
VIREHHEHIPDDFRVKVAKVYPFATYPVCPKCSHNLGANIPALRRWLLAHGSASQNYAYCQGDRNSRFQAPAIKMGHEGPQFTVEEMSTPCFGIIDEHLHLQCGRCKFNWLMACCPAKG